MIKGVVNFAKDNWDLYIVDVEVAYSSTVSSITLCSSFFIKHGIHPKVHPIDTKNLNNPSPSEFIEPSIEAAKFGYGRIIKQDEKMEAYA